MAEAALAPAPESDNFIRLPLVFIKAGRKIVQGLFNSILDPSILPRILQNHRAMLNHLKASKIISHKEMVKLFPSSTTYGESKNFDLTLLLKLLRNICNLTAPATGWDKLPNDNDLSLEADLTRIKYYHNHIFANTPDIELTEHEFNHLWPQIEGALLRIVHHYSPGSVDEWRKSFEKSHKRVSLFEYSHTAVLNEFPDLSEGHNSVTASNRQHWEEKSLDVVFDPQVPAEIKGRGPQAELAYHEALKHGKVVVNRGRIMLVGQARAGKTSLKKSLLGLPFNPYEESTVGVEVDPSCCSIDVDNVKNWQRITECTQTDFTDNIARLIADNLKHVEEEEKKEDVEEKREDVEEKKEEDVEEKKEEDMEEKKEDVEDADKVAEPIIDKEPSEDDTDRNKNNINRTPDTEEPRIDSINNTKESIPENVIEKVIHYLQGLSLDDSPTEPQTIFSIWDFAGQHVYYASHRVFLSPRALYLMVYNLSKDLKSEAEQCVRQGTYDILLENTDKETNLESILSWLASINSILPVNDQEEDQENTDSRKIPGNLPYSRPPVIVVGTNADCPFEDTEEMEVLIKKSISGKSFQKHLVKPFFTVNNTLSLADQGIQRLQGKIIEVLGKEPYMGVHIPVRWLIFEKAIKALVEKNTYHIPLPDLEKIIEEGCFIKESNEIHAMLDYYHDLGVIIKHGDTVVLQAQWLIDLFRKLITVRPYDDQNSKFEKCWNDLEESGILRMELVEHVFGELLDSFPSKEDILSMMEHYGLIARFEEGTDARYFVPAQLTSSPELVDTQPSSVGPCALYVDFVDGFVPHGLYSYFISKFIGWYSKSVDGGQHEPNLYRNVSRFIIGKKSDYELFLICRKRFIKVVLKSIQERKSCLYQPAVSVRRSIESTLREISDECNWYRSLRYQFTVLCLSCCQSSKLCAKHRVVGCSNDDCIHLLKVSPQQFLVCRKCFGKDTKPEVQNLKVWYPTPKPAEGSIPTDKLMCLACDIGDKWKVLGRRLGLSEADLDEIETDEIQLKGRCNTVLKRWTEIQGSSANYESLNIALTHPTVQLYDLALEYCGYLGSAVRPGTPGSTLLPPSQCIKKETLEKSPITHRLTQALKIYLDPKRPMGKDYQDLADSFGYNSVQIQYLGTMDSPTVTLLEENNQCTIEQLRDKLKDMGRDGSVGVIDDFVEQHGCNCENCSQ